ncbi:hypothetical protein XFLM_10410 [Xylella fastidiosa subsp. fastidiosa GB514]|nr:hypothetical protein XFLM_10410 [Xylella fastidiosa subsp. fastidiosa GB514]
MVYSIAKVAGVVVHWISFLDQKGISEMINTN